ncbi:MAG: Gx transporter family protein [Ruminococcaceae bacterium]|nr:Gx transporter family protein [Oscillospiraceae bacterium]
MASLAIVFGYIEHLIPLPFGIYGIKLGLANLVVVIMLYALNAYSAFAINTVRIILCSILFGSFTSFWYSIVGGLLSFVIMLIIKRTDKFSPMGVSICGAIAHNIGQIAVAIVLLEEIKIALYLPVLLITGTLTGALIGLVSIPIIKMPIFNKK